MTANNKLLITIGIIIVFMLGYIIFKDNINWYFKRNEILKRTNIYNIPDVAVKCYDFITSVNDDAVPNQDCINERDKYRPKIKEWENLIKSKKDINCGDFLSSKDAKYFYHYVSGELAGNFYEYNTTPNPKSFAWKTPKDLYCTYDPYGLDTNHDCNACEN